ncbi:MAG: DHHA1 domain-containing protein [Candidatus Pacebacteria bacterium]|nr:DHHA1 domain-containing protein [Candidatus Paceibacterota bacterium]
MPNEIKNLTQASEKILEAIKKKEKIILYGDADLDGVSSVIILKEAIKNLNGKVAAVYFPDRETEGYGITKAGLDSLKIFSPALLVALDLGIGNFAEVKLAKKLGFEVIIIDHHEILDKLPDAKVIVDPKQEGDKYLFKKFANAGLVFKLSEILLRDLMTEALRKNFLELTALATIADMMPKEAENEIFIAEGLKSLENSWRPGIRAFFEGKYFNDFSPEQRISKIISILNVRDVENGYPACFRLFSFSSIDESKKLIEKLLEKREQSRKEMEDIVQEIENRLMGKPEEKIIFEGDRGWEFTSISPIASILSQEYKKPVFIFKILGKESQGTVRAPKGVDIVVLMKKCKNLLLTYGGHPLAAGFRIKNENLEKFRKCLIKNLKGMKPR